MNYNKVLNVSFTASSPREMKEQKTERVYLVENLGLWCSGGVLGGLAHFKHSGSFDAPGTQNPYVMKYIPINYCLNIACKGME